ILTDKPAGVKGKTGKFPKNTVNYHLIKNLEKFHKKMQEEHEHEPRVLESEKEEQQSHPNKRKGHKPEPYES
ncbi:MAG TPA: hypothetical protein P5107_02480, partial [Thermotogota bacterium]|nr:hypothetical protein [Thermotogota bacterium]HRW33904.1 hypothetical protein [Thermotogota bacterium]